MLSSRIASQCRHVAVMQPLSRSISHAAALSSTAVAAAASAPSSAPVTSPHLFASSKNKVTFTLPKVKAGAATAKKQGVTYPLETAIQLARSNATANFDETVSISVRLNLDPRKPNQSVRGAASLPNGTGKSVRVAVFAKGEKAQEAKAAGADIVGEKELVDQILAGKIDFDRCIATPDMMAFVGRVARVLGPRGLMPNPKVGTVTNDVMAAVKSSKMGSVEFKTDKTGVVAVPVGKASFTAKALAENIESFVEKLVDLKPSGAQKGAYILSSFIASTQGPGVPLDTKAHPFKNANAASAGPTGENGAATMATGRYGKMHSVNGFDVVRYDLGAFPTSEAVTRGKGKWPQVISTIKQSRKTKDSWKVVLDKVQAINSSDPLPVKKAATPTPVKAAKPAAPAAAAAAPAAEKK